MLPDAGERAEIGRFAVKNHAGRQDANRADRAWARLLHRRSNDLLEDAMIAATAQVHGMIVATRNIRDFVDLGVETFNPFAGGAAG